MSLDDSDQKIGMQGCFDRIDVALADYAEQTRLAVHYPKILEPRLGALESRVDKLESK